MLASIPLSKSYLSSTSLNQPVLNKDLQASVNFETKSADIATLNNNKFFIKQQITGNRCISIVADIRVVCRYKNGGGCIS